MGYADFSEVVSDMKKLFSYKILSDKQTRKLIKKYNSCQNKACSEALSCKHKLLLHNMRLVYKIANKFYIKPNGAYNINDLVQDGVIGLNETVERFQPGRSKFSTYAWWWIMQSAGRKLQENRRTIRVPQHVDLQVARYNRHMKEYEFSFYKKFSEEEFLNQIGLTQNDIKRINYAKALDDIRSIDELAGDGKNTLGSMIEDFSQRKKAVVNKEALESFFFNYAHCKNQRDRDIVYERFFEGQTMSLLSAKYSVSVQRIEQITSKAFDRVQKAAESSGRRMYEFMNSDENMYKIFAETANNHHFTGKTQLNKKPVLNSGKAQAGVSPNIDSIYAKLKASSGYMSKLPEKKRTPNVKFTFA